ncbi:hypothetical protein TWF106_000323 [Orbilia oligospora]|uniref:non-specific serine/threonine protein kinase n=1 Tax=Orbilia oligospora TaxID=2813651 RepID=A0A7C8UZM7_ORBOL|nr:hypothetical protein TWF106_000323 [Orbilia oligospora]
MPRGAAAPRQEQVFFSSRSGHMKMKKSKAPAVEFSSGESADDKASETLSKRRISTVASLRAVKAMALPNSKAHLPSAQRERPEPKGSNKLWGGLSSRLGNEDVKSAPNPYASKKGLYTEGAAISTTVSSSTRPRSTHSHNTSFSSDPGHHSHRPSYHSDHRPEIHARNVESRLSHISSRSNTSAESGYWSQSGISESKESRFWDDARISNTVTKEFIEDCLRKVPATEPLIPRLSQPVGFGDGLTETTYAEWIISRAQKLFLILVDLGIPEQIFWITDDSWGDDDLPISLESIPRLKLSRVVDPVLDRKFHKAQYNYLLRFLYNGAHIDFEEFETVPLDIIKNYSVLFSQPVDQVRCPRNPDNLFTRKRFPLVDRDGNSLLPEFMEEVESFRVVSHRHIVELWASYTFKGHGYLLLSPATDFTLRSFLHNPPAEFSKMAEDSRRFKLLDWMRCLSDGLAYLYDQEIPHGDIRPRSIVIDGKTGEIYFSDVGSQRRLAFARTANANDNERYEYSAPELFLRVAQFSISQSPTGLHFDGGRTGRRMANPAHRDTLEGKKKGSINVPPTSADGTETSRRFSLQSDFAPSFTSSNQACRGTPMSGACSPLSFDAPSHAESHRTFTTSQKGVSTGAVQVAEWICRPAAKSDVFSLGCIMLDMLTFHSQKKKLSNFPSARARHNRAAGSRGGGQPDSSFHANIPETNEWIKDLHKEATKRDDEVVAAVLVLVSQMLSKDPEERPSPREVGDTLFRIMTFVKEPHCEQFVEWTSNNHDSFGNWSGWDDVHDYSSPIPPEGADYATISSKSGKEYAEPQDGIHQQISRLSFGTFGGSGASLIGKSRMQHSRNESLSEHTRPNSQTPDSGWNSRSGSSLEGQKMKGSNTNYL